jgi:hypothetical protein
MQIEPLSASIYLTPFIPFRVNPSPSKERRKIRKEGLTPLLDTLIGCLVKGLEGAKPL